jgi:hypothetical protein
MQKKATKTSETAIFGRLIKTDDGDLSRDLARYVLTLGFGEEDQTRMRDLAERNQQGALSPEESEELQNYVKAGHLLALLHSKARSAQVESPFPLGWRLPDRPDRRRARDGGRSCDERA